MEEESKLYGEAEGSNHLHLLAMQLYHDLQEQLRQAQSNPLDQKGDEMQEVWPKI